MGIAKKKGKDRTPLAWKSMQLDGALISQGIEGLIGIEELTNYSLTKKKSPFSKALKVTKVSAPPLKLAKVKKSSEHDKKEEKSPITLPATEKDTSECQEKREIKRAKKLLREKKRKEKKRGQKLNVILAKKKAKSNPSTLPLDIRSEATNAKESIVSATTETSNKNVGKKQKNKNRKGKLEQIIQIESNDLDTETLIDETAEPLTSRSLPNKAKRKSAISATNQPENKKKKIDDASDNSSKMSKNKKGKRKKTKKSTESKILQAGKSKESALPKDSGADDSTSNATPSKPIQGMESWAGLNLPDSILRALSENGFKKPTEIQACSMPAAILGRRDIMGAAETGSGKTLAFGIPILYGILQQKKRDAEKAANAANLLEGVLPEDEEDGETAEDSGAQQSESDHEEEVYASPGDSGDESEYVDANEGGIGCVKVIDNADFSFMEGFTKTVVEKPSNPKYNHKLYALILTPTRELAVQVKNHIAAAAKYTGIRVTVVIGGLAHQKQERLLKTNPEIVVATPGRLWELIQEGNPFLQQIDDISFLAIDETDRMIEKGHFQELQQLLLRINEDEEKKKRRQNFVFSATLTMVHEPPQRKKTSGKKQQTKVTPGQKLQDVIKMLGISQPKVVDVTRESGTARTLEEAQIRCTFEEKDVYLYYFLVSNPGRTLVFCNSISCVRRLAQILTILKVNPLPVHANMIQRQRLKNLDKFRDNPTGLLLATDVAARGLDIPDVEHVIHYQVPRTSEGYIHRSGRTARASKGGLTLLLIEPAEQQTYSRLCKTLGRTNELPAFGVSQDLLSAAKERVHLARDIDRLELTSKKSDAELGWYQKALADMDMVLDKSELPSRISEEDSAKNRKASSARRKQLESLLSRPLFTRK